MKDRMIRNGLAVAVILLFLGFAIQPSVAVQPETEIDVEPKDYLFQTIIDIANNPDVKNLLEQYENDLVKVDIDRSVYRKIFLRNPRLLFNTLFTKPSLTYDYLDKCYNKGIEITNILGEDKVYEMMETIEVTDTKLFDELNDIISKDEELSKRLTTLKERNNELKSVSPFEDNPIICSILAIIITYAYIQYVIFYEILSHIKDRPIIESFITLFITKSFWTFMITEYIGLVIFCWGNPYI